MGSRSTLKRWLHVRDAALAAGSGLLVLACLLPACKTPPAAPAPPAPPRLTDEPVDSHVVQAVDETLDRIAAAPDDLEAWIRLAKIYQANEVFELAEQTYEHIVEVGTDDPQVWFLLARTRDSLGKPDEALEALDQMIELEQGYGPAFWVRGEWRFGRGDVDGAESDFARAVELQPDEPAGHVGLARVHLERGEAQRAVDLLLPLIGASRGQPHLHLILGNAYRQLGRLEEARRHLQRGQGERLERLDPWTAALAEFRFGFGSRVSRASRQLSEGQTELAVQTFEELRGERPTDLRVLTKLGLGYLTLGRIEDALEVLELAVREHPDSFRSHLDLASALEMSGDPDRALVHIRRAIELNPEFALAYARRGVILQRLKRYEEAIESYREALRFHPEDSKLLRAVGDCYGLLKQWERAAAAYAAAIRVGSDDVDLYMRMASVSMVLGRIDVAEASLLHAQELGPEDPARIARYLEQIRQLKAKAAAQGKAGGATP